VRVNTGSIIMVIKHHNQLKILNIISLPGSLILTLQGTEILKLSHLSCSL